MMDVGLLVTADLIQWIDRGSFRSAYHLIVIVQFCVQLVLFHSTYSLELENLPSAKFDSHARMLDEREWSLFAFDI